MSIRIEHGEFRIIVDTENELVMVLRAIRQSQGDRQESSLQWDQGARHLNGDASENVRPESTEFSNSTIRQCALAILSRAPTKKMHFRDIANEAMKRGYKGRGSKTRSPRLAAQRSFEQTMRGDKSFECVGDGVFRLREGFGTLKGE